MKYMEILDKGNFVAFELFSLCKKINCDIMQMRYVVASPSQEEYVEVVYKNNYRQRICVTADSLYAMSLDTLRYISK